ncbi:MAG: peptide chain release factor 1, partial [Aquificota bacterium]
MKSLKDAIERLLSFRPDGYMVTNLYLRLGVEERTDRKYLRTFKDLVKAQKEYSEGWGLKDDVLKSVEEDF